ncbi:hypothetical protein [Vogesella oryzae]|uniref:hypothetical protein n=1 Tax=Vogesella oryzae TaxID=1735285 RepID=UPI0015823397|nr:hypothetical protein [Vogesella oryzae]
MAEAALLHSLARRLEQASLRQDWQALAAADAELAQLAQRLQQRQLSSAERSLLPRLQAAHRQARRSCDTEMQRLGEQLAGWQDNREGWVAYALAAEEME